MAFDRILIANRGEIAVRINRTAQALGYRTVAVYSEADRDAPHVRAADFAVSIGPPPAALSYLDGGAIIDAARRAGAGAIHPGYGFLAENAEFAAACEAAAIVFIGPPADSIRLMGNKRLAKERMQESGVACVPGYHGAAEDDSRLTEESAAIGFPLMVKAASGGGGRGLRRVEAKQDLAAALRAARSEAKSAFGSDELILERLLVAPRHVEIQVFADAHGNVVHLGERDCSIQRRHQKIVEEAPSPAVSPELRERMGAAAVAATRAVDYRGAGTVEFLLAGTGEFYFLEMNTRLQVEHPVTEMIAGLDLVDWQLRVAAGEPLPLAQDQIEFHGHAIEARLYAEDPAAGFMPRTGRVAAWRPAGGEGVRVDHGIAAGQEITPHYDPMLAKLIAHGATREEARRRLVRALYDTVFLGIASNRRFLIDLLSHEAFARGETDTAFIERHFPAERRAAPPHDPLLWALAGVLIFERTSGGRIGWRSAMPAVSPLDLEIGDARETAHVAPLPGRIYDVELSDRETRRIAVLETGSDRVRFAVDDLQGSAAFVFEDEILHLDLDGRAARIGEVGTTAGAADRPGDGRLLAPMTGRIVAVNAKQGAKVRAGDILVVIEAMKMEHEIRAAADGAVAEIAVKPGDQVDARQLLAVVADARAAKTKAKAAK